MRNSDHYFERDELKIVLKRHNGGTNMLWTGVSDARNPADILAPFLDRVIEQMEGRIVTVDFTGMEFMNSSTVGVIMGMVKRLDITSEAVKIVFANSDWQRVHLRCMKAVARALTRIEVEGRNVTSYSPHR